MSQVSAAAVGSKITLKASVTFPQGITLSKFADDADAFDIPDITIADSGVGLNGTHIVWSKPVVTELTANMIPNTDEDTNLSILFDANRISEDKAVAGDEITMVIAYPNGEVTTLSQGIIISGQPAKSASQAGRLKTRPYKFRFTVINTVRVAE